MTGPNSDQGNNADRQRIDKWLWCARFFKTRAGAAAFVAAHSVRLRRNGSLIRVNKPAFAVAIGDELSFMTRERLVVIAVIAVAQRRLSPALAKTLYADRQETPDVQKAV
ncbi:MAG: hypothetical protein R3C40_01760 [Parvularculaceae bacterium]